MERNESVERRKKKLQFERINEIKEEDNTSNCKSNQIIKTTNSNVDQVLNKRHQRIYSFAKPSSLQNSNVIDNSNDINFESFVNKPEETYPTTTFLNNEILDVNKDNLNNNLTDFQTNLNVNKKDQIFLIDANKPIQIYYESDKEIDEVKNCFKIKETGKSNEDASQETTLSK